MSKSRHVVDPLSVKQSERPIASVLIGMAAQENCDGEPYDQMQAAAEYILELERKLDELHELADSMCHRHCRNGFLERGMHAPECWVHMFEGDDNED